MPGPESISVVCRDVEVGRLERSLRGLRLGMAPIWAANRLPPLLQDPATRGAVDTYEELLFGAVRQWSRARRAGRRTLTLRLSIPAEMAAMVLSLARQVCELMVEEKVMLAVGLEPVSRNDARYALRLIEQAERSLADNTGP